MLSQVPGIASASPSAGVRPVLLADRGRPPVGAWDDELSSFELHLSVTGFARGTISTRMTSVRHMAAWMTANGLPPQAVSNRNLSAYLLGELERRKPPHSSAGRPAR
jgi:hypothetical protein